MSAVLPMTTSAPTRPVLKPEVQATIDTTVLRLVAEFHPEQIWLFGSYAWGEPDEHSDLDFVVVLPRSDETPIKRAQRAHRCLRGSGMPNDVLVKTRAEFERYRDLRPSLTFKIANEGRLIYETGASQSAAPMMRHTPDSTEERLAELVSAWLTKAQHGLIAAHRIASEDDTLLGNALFHCQQAAEKTLKGYLTAQEQATDKRLALNHLLSECATFEPSFKRWEADVESLTRLTSSFRYPDETPVAEPTRAEFEQAIAAAQRIYDFVLSLLPTETHPT